MQLSYKGVNNSDFHVLVCGLPGQGKSTLMNCLNVHLQNHSINHTMRQGASQEINSYLDRHRFDITLNGSQHVVHLYEVKGNNDEFRLNEMREELRKNGCLKLNHVIQIFRGSERIRIVQQLFNEIQTFFKDEPEKMSYILTFMKDDLIKEEKSFHVNFITDDSYSNIYFTDKDRNPNNAELILKDIITRMVSRGRDSTVNWWSTFSWNPNV